MTHICLFTYVSGPACVIFTYVFAKTVRDFPERTQQCEQLAQCAAIVYTLQTRVAAMLSVRMLVTHLLATCKSIS